MRPGCRSLTVPECTSGTATAMHILLVPCCIQHFCQVHHGAEVYSCELPLSKNLEEFRSDLSMHFLLPVDSPFKLSLQVSGIMNV